MAARKKQQFSQAVRDAAVRLAQAGTSVKEVAEKIGAAPEEVQAWVNEAGADALPWSAKTAWPITQQWPGRERQVAEEDFRADVARELYGASKDPPRPSTEAAGPSTRARAVLQSESPSFRARDLARQDHEARDAQIREMLEKAPSSDYARAYGTPGASFQVPQGGSAQRRLAEAGKARVAQAYAALLAQQGELPHGHPFKDLAPDAFVRAMIGEAPLASRAGQAVVQAQATQAPVSPSSTRASAKPASVRAIAPALTPSQVPMLAPLVYASGASSVLSARPDLLKAVRRVEQEQSARPSSSPHPLPAPVAVALSAVPSTRRSVVAQPAQTPVPAPRTEGPETRTKGPETRTAPGPEGVWRQVKPGLKDRMRTCNAQALKDALAAAGGNKSQAARDLGISREGMRKALIRIGVR